MPTSFLNATAVPVAPLPFPPQRSERRLLFCCVPMSFRRKRTRRCCRPRCRASGRTTSGCRRSRRAQWPASSKSQSCCATSTSPVSFTTACTRISRKATSFYTQYTYFLQNQTCTYPPSLCPAFWTCLLAREYANQTKGKMTFSTSNDLHRLTNVQLSGCRVGVLCQSSSVCARKCVYVAQCVPHVHVCVCASLTVPCFKYLTSWTEQHLHKKWQ